MSDRVEQVAKAWAGRTDLQKVSDALECCCYGDGITEGDYEIMQAAIKKADERLSATQEVWTTEPPTVPGMYIRAWKVVGYWQYSVELMTNGVFEMEGNGHKYTADEIFEGCQWFGPFTPPPAPVGDDTKGG